MLVPARACPPLRAVVKERMTEDEVAACLLLSRRPAESHCDRESDGREGMGKASGGVHGAEAEADVKAGWLGEVQYETILRGHSGAVTSLTAPDDCSFLLTGTCLARWDR